MNHKDNTQGNGKGADTPGAKVVLHCIERRFRELPQVAEAMNALFPERDYYLISLAGGAKPLLEASPTGSVMAQHIQQCCQTVGATSLFVLQHEDCKACGGSKRFKAPETEGLIPEELGFHRELAMRAAPLLAQLMPDLLIRRGFMRMTGEVLPLE